MSMSQIQKYKLETKPSVSKMLMALKRQKRSLTQQHSVASTQQHTVTVSGNVLYPMMEKSKDFPSIFSQHKRNDYSGYKQINPSKAKNIKLQSETQNINRYQTPRKYQINTKNIAKLRKRYSLEPIRVKEFQKEQQRMFMATSKSLQKAEISKKEESNSERNYHKELRQILRMMNIHKHASSGKTIPHEAKTNDSLESTPQNLSLMNSQSPQENYDSLSTTGQKIQPTPQKIVGFNKPYYVQIKKRVENKIYQTNKKKILPSIGKLPHKSKQQELCGWSTQSFYPKNRSQFFEDPHDEKLKLIQGEI